MLYYLRYMSIATQSEILTRAQVAAIFQVHVGTVSRWADEHLLPFFTTPGGQRRFYRADVEAFMERSAPREHVAAS